MSKANKIKEIVKGGFGTNPFDPWSPKAGITESEEAMLQKFLKSRGINPEFVSKDTKIAHSKSGEFKKWKIDHQSDMFESVSQEQTPTQKRLGVLKTAVTTHKEIRTTAGTHDNLHSEEVDEKDIVSMDIPLLIRVLELAREDLKDDADLHRVVEKLIDIRNKGTLTMDDYDFVASLKEEFQQLDELSIDKLEKYRAGAKAHISKLEKDYEAGDRSQKRATDIKKRDVGVSKAFHKIMKAKKSVTPVKSTPSKPVSTGDAIAKDYKDQEAKRGIGHVRDHVELEGQQLTEISKEKANAYMWSAKSDRQQTDDQINKEMEKQGSGWSKRRHTKIGKLLDKSMKRTKGIDSALTRLSKEETELDEAKEANYGGGYQASVLAVKAKAEKKPVDMASLAARMQASYAKDEKKPVKEDMYQDSQAATQMPFDTGNNPAEATVNPKLSKAQYIKSFIKKKVVKEELYDQDKDDKPVQTNGKKPKVSQQVDKYGDDSSQAAIVMAGGKTLTGEPRDTIEIDPMLRKPKGGDVNAPATDGKATDKKDKQ